MSYHDKLVADIHERLDRAEASGDLPVAKWIAHDICTSHLSALHEDGEHTEYWRYCGYHTTREMVRVCVSKRSGKEELATGDQGLLPGFEHVRQKYLVPRGGLEVSVSVYAMTHAEIMAKVAFYRDMGAGCFAHAEELVRFLSTRNSSPEAANE
jgi:hypothetical protein